MITNRRSILALILALVIAATAAAQPKTAAPVNVNTATIEQLETVKGIGPKLAAAIVAARPFKSLDDLKRVKGIKDKRLTALRPLLTVNR